MCKDNETQQKHKTKALVLNIIDGRPKKNSISAAPRRHPLRHAIPTANHMQMPRLTMRCICTFLGKDSTPAKHTYAMTVPYLCNDAAISMLWHNHCYAMTETPFQCAENKAAQGFAQPCPRHRLFSFQYVCIVYNGLPHHFLGIGQRTI